MDYSQQSPAPAMQPPEVNQSTVVDPYYAWYYGYYANPNPNFTSDLKQTHESSVPPPPGVVDTTQYHSFDTNAQTLAWQEAVHLYGTDPLPITETINGTEQAHGIYPSFSWTDHIVPAQLPSSNIQLKKGKIVQSVYCEVCKVDCNGPTVFEQHLLGKKHLKNLEKLKTCLPFNTCSGSSLSGLAAAVPLIGPQENPCTNKVRKKSAAESRPEDLESKRRRVVECGVSNESVRLCRICNVVCNSDTVYNDHIAGQKHATKAAKRRL